MPRITSKELFAWSSYLGNLVGDNFPILQETACMSIEYRRLYSYVEIIKRIASKKDQKQLSEIQEYIKILGQSEWEKDTLTDMALRLGTKTKFHSAIRDSDMLDVTIKEEWDEYLEQEEYADSNADK